jgi:hypothetical protein
MPAGDRSAIPSQIPVTQTPQEEPFSEAHLGSPEYRERLMRKLNCLIAVLEVATARVRKNLAGAPEDSERLTRICNNLQSTLEVCLRARLALQKRQAIAVLPPPPAPPIAPADAIGPPAPPTPESPRKRGKGKRRVGSDLSTEAEKKRFSKLPPIDRRAVNRCDLDDLARRLTG